MSEPSSSTLTEWKEGKAGNEQKREFITTKCEDKPHEIKISEDIMNKDIYEQLKAIAVNDIGIDEDKIKPESDIIKELGLDSLDIVDMLMKVEETFGVTIDDSDVAEMRTVADVVSFIENAKA